MPDPCHLLKNVKAAMYRQILSLPQTYVELEALPTVVDPNVIDSKCS